MIQTKAPIAFLILSIMALIAIVCWLISFAHDSPMLRRMTFVYMLTTVVPWMMGVLLLTKDC